MLNKVHLRHVVIVIVAIVHERLAWSWQDSMPEAVLEVVVGAPDSNGVRSMDLLQVAENGGVVIDPFFRAPGLDFTEVIFHRGGTHLDVSTLQHLTEVQRAEVQRAEVPRWETRWGPQAEEFCVGSLNAPENAIVGARFWLDVRDIDEKRATNAEKTAFYASLVRFKSPQQRDSKGHKDEVDAISEPALIGEYWYPRFTIAQFDDIPADTRMKATAGTPVLPAVRIHTNAYGTSFDIRFLNLTNASIELFSPFLNYSGGGFFPVQLWVNRSGEVEQRRDIVHSMMGTLPHKRMAIRVPSGAIVGSRRIVRLPPGEYTSQFVVSEAFLTEDRPIDAESGRFLDFPTTSAKTILTTPELPFTVP